MSKKFKVAKAGKTVDGREITKQDLQDIAATYEPNNYTAMIWLEHDRSRGNYGFVSSVELGEEGGETYLFAELVPSDELRQLNIKKQKVFSSIEIGRNDEGKAYLVGLGVTDSPASFGTEFLKFNLQNQENIYSVQGFNENLSFELKEQAQTFAINFNFSSDASASLACFSSFADLLAKYSAVEVLEHLQAFKSKESANSKDNAETSQTNQSSNFSELNRNISALVAMVQRNNEAMNNFIKSNTEVREPANGNNFYDFSGDGF